MFTVMAPFRSTSKRSAVPASGPVFLDTSGRRLRRARLAGFMALALVGGYVVLFFVAFFGGPDIVAPYLPKPPAAVPRAEKPLPAHSPSSTPQHPAGAAAQVGTTAPGGGTVSAQQAAPGIPAAPAVPAAPAAAVATAVPVHGSRAQAAEPAGSTAQGNAGATPAPVPQGQGQQTATEPGKSEAAPGQTARPTPPPHP